METLKQIVAVALILYIVRNIFIAPILNRLDYLIELFETPFEEEDNK